jgi:hypothetical protein
LTQLCESIKFADHETLADTNDDDNEQNEHTGSTSIDNNKPTSASAHRQLPSPATPDGRYFVVRKRLWRLSNPALSASRRELLTRQLMAARRAVRTARNDVAELRRVRARVDAAKRALGERGPVWWAQTSDSDRDWNRCLVTNSPYKCWWESKVKDAI